jgi:hypothetical protein
MAGLCPRTRRRILARVNDWHDEPAEGAAASPPSDSSEPGVGWEPTVPSPRAIAPSVVGGAIVPLAVYYLVRHEAGSDAAALAIAGIPAAGWVTLQWVRHRRVDPIGAIVVLGFAGGLAVSAALGGSAFVLKVRDSAFTCLLGLACFLSLRFRRPVMFYLGRSFSAGDDPDRRAAYEGLWTLPGGPHTFRVITAVWGVGLICDAGLRVMLAASLPTGAFLATSPTAAGLMFSALFAFTVWYSRAARRRRAPGLAPTET